MTDREAILGRLRRAARHQAAHPGAYAAPPQPGDWAAFAASLAEAGGEAHGPYGRHSLGDALVRLIRRRAEGGRVVLEASAAELAGRGPWQVAREPAVGHAFADVAVAVVLGRAAAADCGAVAVVESDAPHRALPFLCQRLVLLLPASALRADLHGAWAALPAAAWRGHHVTWVSGPSKTADIEQTLVYGAHGPLSLDVVGVAD